MKNKKRYKMAAAGLLCAGLLWAGAMNGYAKEAEGLTLPDKEIVNYFISGFKTTPQSDYGRLRGRMESLVLTDHSDNVERGEQYIIVTLKYEDGTKDSFYFFQTAPDVEEWYVEAEDRTIYQGGDFISEYIQADLFPDSVPDEDTEEKSSGMTISSEEGVKESIRKSQKLHEKLQKDGAVCGTEDLRAYEDTEEKSSGMTISSEEGVKESIRKSQKLHEKLQKDGAVCGTEDLRAYFAMNMLRNEESYENTESAMQAVRSSLENGLRVYEYAKQSGRLPSEEEVDAVMDEVRERIKKDINFEKLDVLYKECGTTYDAFKKEMGDYERTEIELELMSRKLREEFQDINFEKLDVLYKECGTTYDAFKKEMGDYERTEIELELMSRKLREEFQLGNDTIGDKVCKNADEYYASFIEDLAFPSTEQYAEEKLKPLLDEAQEYYLSQIAVEDK